MVYAGSMTKDRKLQVFAWGLSLGSVVLAVLAWGEAFSWKFSIVNPYLLFPLLGLIAFSLMWAHFVAGAVRNYFGVKKEVLKSYYEITSVAVLLAILLHPGLLIWQLWRDGRGLPPTSTGNYVAPAARWALILGIISLIIFLAFELHRLYEGRKWWKWVNYASDVAIIMIYIHALRLGGTLMGGWYRWVWYFYGITLAAALVYSYLLKATKTAGNIDK